MDLKKIKYQFDNLFKTKKRKKENENANINEDSAMGSMLKFGAEVSKEYYLNDLISPRFAHLHKTGNIHIHDLDFYGLTTTCCQIDIDSLFKTGFDTGHGHIRPPQDIKTYAALACIILQSNQNDQHGGQAIPNFDYAMAKGVRKSFKKHLKNNLLKAFKFNNIKVPSYLDLSIEHLNESDVIRIIREETPYAHDMGKTIISESWQETIKDTHQAMESLVHNLNTMQSRAGAQVPFSSINYGTDTSVEGRIVIQAILEATRKGLGKGETPVFPIQIFRLKDGVNLHSGDANYDLFELACRVSAKRLFPNFSFQDAPFNLQYYKQDDIGTYISYMGCRTRVMGNVYDKSYEKTFGRGNLSFTSINLAGLALERCDIDTTNYSQNLIAFYAKLDEIMESVYEQLLERFEVQKKKHVKNYPFLMGQGVWKGSKGLSPEDSVHEILKHGTLAIGFVGLAEALKVICGSHHGESALAQQLGLDIIKRMRAFCDAKAESTKLNFSLIATPAESLAGRFLEIDKHLFGVVPGVTDKDYYTNSFHVPVTYKLPIKSKIDIEAPYHALCNGGHITYIELDSCSEHNPDAMMSIIKYMAKSGVGYGSINHPVDHDTICGYSGIIGDTCPHCGRDEQDTPFKRIRRITGYLVGDLTRFNSAKLSEVKDRVKHS